jgi:hypothetical protein
MGRQYGIPSVLTKHCSGFSRLSIFPWRWPLIREDCRHAHVVIAASSFLKQALVDQSLAAPSTLPIPPTLSRPISLPSLLRLAPPHRRSTL